MSTTDTPPPIRRPGASPDGGAVSSAMPVLRILTWNIRHGAAIAEAASEIATNDSLRTAGVVLAQEVDGAAAGALAVRLGMGVVAAPGTPHRSTGRGFGTAILARAPLTGRAELSLPHRARWYGQERTAIGAKVRLPMGDVTVWSAHTETPAMGLRRRTEQFEAMATEAAATLGPVIVGGDFNTPTGQSRRSLVATMAATGFVHASAGSGPTLRRWGRWFHLDHVFVRGLRMVDVGVAPTTSASDHLPLWVDVSCEPQGRQPQAGGPSAA